MRLSKIKLSGFKSFVDPLSVQLPADLTAVVGPNGCGKSNIIDAVRWVMGETSAKHLRGDTMEDVIFNGSGTRKPLAQASVELLFDNCDGALGGEYAAYNEISVRRQVTRDGESKYFLNGTRCRKRDITDIFLGTGLGPKSYAIIEQGMISRVVDAKPQELRVYIEEAAGISKYKQRRRETENRIRHTRDNLSRLNDLREEIEKTIAKLQRQSRAAERYTELKQQEREAKAGVIALKFRGLSEELQERQQALEREQTAVEKQVAEVRTVETRIESMREQRQQQAEQVEQLQAAFYEVGSSITRLEQRIAHQKELIERQQQELKETGEQLLEIERHIRDDEKRLEVSTAELASVQPELETALSLRDKADTELQMVEENLQVWQDEWDDYNRKQADINGAVASADSRIEQLERQLKLHSDRDQRLHSEQAGLGELDLPRELSLFDDEVRQSQSDIGKRQAEMEAVGRQIAEERERQSEIRQQIDQAQSRVHAIQSDVSTIDALLRRARGKDNDRLQSWLDARGLGAQKRLLEQISVESPWTEATELVLGVLLEAIPVADLDTIGPEVDVFDEGEINLYEHSVHDAERSSGQPHGTLWSVVQAPAAFRQLLQSVHLADNLTQALHKRVALREGESIVTPEGHWIGPQWMRSRKAQGDSAGILRQQERREQLQQDLQDSREVLSELNLRYQKSQSTIAALESSRETHQKALSTLHNEYAEKNALLTRQRARHEETESRRKALAREIQEVREHLREDQATLERARADKTQAVEQSQHLSGIKRELEQRREQITHELQRVRGVATEKRELLHQVQIRREKWLGEKDNMEKSIARLRENAGARERKQLQLRETIAQAMAQDDAPALELEQLIAQRVEREQALNGKRSELAALDDDIRQQDEARREHEATLQQKREALEGLKIAQQEKRTRQQTLQEQLDETGMAYDEIITTMNEDLAISDMEQRVEKLSRRIAGLGPINLAAIDEFKEQSERKEYLDQQHEDLETALATLERAIAKIDRETRTRFKTTFEQVNARMGEMFGKLFGGGSAHLELTEDDLLTTGVAIMARPPGKRISNIHLMSGGEKALTAVSLVFSIFELNPAPFCMLDEVDAPLDEANVGRFCELVKDMSERVQFIVITHNKVTMEMTDSLLGVTMREAGVSRLVDVNLDEAVLMATA